MFDRQSIMDSVSACITARLKHTGMKAYELANRTGVTAAAISQVINKNRCMTIPLLMRVCFVLNVSLETMVGYDNSALKEADKINGQIKELEKTRDELLAVD